MKFLSGLFFLTVLLALPVHAVGFDLQVAPAVGIEKDQNTIDYTSHPRVHAHAIVLFEPLEDLNLMIPSKLERKIVGKVLSGIRQLVGDDQIFFPAESFTMSLKSGVRVRMYLMQFENRNAFYPIAIFPESYPVEQK